MGTSVNNKCRSFTSLKQSRKLAEILPLDSADMWYWEWPTAPSYNSYEHPMFHKGEDIHNVPCWSLAALLDLIPDIIEDYVLRIDKVDGEYFIWYDKIGEGWSDHMVHPSSENFIDVVVETVVWLKENGKI